MSEPKKLGATFSPAARQHVESRLSAIKSYTPNLGLLYGVDPAHDNGKGSWSVAALADQTVAELVSQYEQYGTENGHQGKRLIAPRDRRREGSKNPNSY